MQFKKLNILNKEEKTKEDEILTKGIVEIYKEVLRGDRARFPSGTWMRPDAIKNVVKCIKYLIEEKLKLTDNDVKNKINKNFFKFYKLSGMLQTCFNNSYSKAINEIYPDRFKPWEFKSIPDNYWTEETSVKAVKWLIEDKLHLSEEELKEQLSVKLFIENNLSGLIYKYYKGSPFLAINSVYPRKFKPWNFSQVPKSYWTVEKGIEATKWLVEEKLKLTDDELKEKLSKNLFKENNLLCMLNACFNNSPFEAINASYPAKFKKEDFRGYNLNHRCKINYT